MLLIVRQVHVSLFLFSVNRSAASNQTKSSGTVPVHQQILALVSAPFGDSPLLRNLLPVTIATEIANIDGVPNFEQHRRLCLPHLHLQASGKTEELLKPANAPSKMLNGPQYKVTADNKSPKIKAKVVTPAQLSKVRYKHKGL